MQTTQRGRRMTTPWLVIATLSVSACATSNHVICYGAGTCGADGTVPHVGHISTPHVNKLQIGTASYMIVTTSSGRVITVIQTAK